MLPYFLIVLPRVYFYVLTNWGDLRMMNSLGNSWYCLFYYDKDTILFTNYSSEGSNYHARWEELQNEWE